MKRNGTGIRHMVLILTMQIMVDIMVLIIMGATLLIMDIRVMGLMVTQIMVMRDITPDGRREAMGRFCDFTEEKKKKKD